MVLFVSMMKSKSLVSKKKSKAVVTGVEMFRKQLDEGLAGDNVELLRGIQRDEIERGQVIAKPGIPSTHTLNSKVKFTSLLKKKVDVILHSSTTTVPQFYFHCN